MRTDEEMQRPSSEDIEFRISELREWVGEFVACGNELEAWLWATQAARCGRELLRRRGEL